MKNSFSMFPAMFGQKFNAIRNEMDNMFRDFPTLPFTGTSFPIEMWDDKNKVYIEADLPGVTAENLDVSINDGRLRISATRQDTTEKTEGTTYHREVSYGSVERTIEIPECANTETIDAKIKNGILTITLSKRAGTQTRKIEVKS